MEWIREATLPAGPTAGCRLGLPDRLRSLPGAFAVARGALQPFVPVGPASAEAERAVAVRGLVLEAGAERALRRHATCERCAKVHGCLPVFDAVRPQPLAPDESPDVTSGSEARVVVRLGAAGRIAVRGTVAHVRLAADGASARLVPGDVEPHEAIEAATEEPVAVARAQLPARTGSPAFEVVLARAPRADGYRRGRFAVVAAHAPAHGDALPAGLVLATLEELRTLGYERVRLDGGAEPRTDLAGLVRAARTLGCLVDVALEVPAASAALAASLRRAGAGAVILRLDPAPPAADASEALRLLVQAGLAVDVEGDVTPRTAALLEERVRLAARARVRSLRFGLRPTAPRHAREGGWPDATTLTRLYREVVPRCATLAAEAGLAFAFSPEGDADHPRALDRLTDAVGRGACNPLYLDGGRCEAPRAELFVDASGDVFPCASRAPGARPKVADAADTLAEGLAASALADFASCAGTHDACRLCAAPRAKARPARLPAVG